MRKWLLILVLLMLHAAGCQRSRAVDRADSDSSTDSGVGNDGFSSDWNTGSDTDPELDVAHVVDSDCGNFYDCSLVVFIPGGTFGMGMAPTDDYDKSSPEHQVNVPDFFMMQTEVTVAMYEKCVAEDVCSEPGTGVKDEWSNDKCAPENGYLNWGVEGRENHPVNCVDWFQAKAFCDWAGGRLPSEAEWEYAAVNGEDDSMFPWGDAPPGCDYAVMRRNENSYGCGMGSTWDVCSKPEGNTYRWTLCDMAGNVTERVADDFHRYSSAAPTDGSAWTESSVDEYTEKVSRGGAFSSDFAQIHLRGHGEPYTPKFGVGFRCATDLE